MNTSASSLSADAIRTQNQVLLLQAKKKVHAFEVSNRKDLMRKLRQKEIVIKQSNYCQVAGFRLKKKPNQVYPLLQQQVARLSKLKEQAHSQLISQLKAVVKMIQDKKLAQRDLDSQVKRLLEQFQEDLQLLLKK